MEYLLSDLAASSGIQQILASFYSNFGITSELWDLDRQVLLASSGSQFELKSNPVVHLSRESRWRDEDDSNSSIPGKLTGRYQGPGKLFRYVRPIHIEERDIAALILGPVLDSAPDPSALRLEAQELEIGETAYLGAVERAPVMPEGQAEGLADFLGELVQRLLEQGIGALRLMESFVDVQEHLEKKTGLPRVRDAYPGENG